MEFTYKTGYGPRLVVKNTNTTGSNAYVVACACGGVMEDPDIHYEDYQLIRAENEAEAENKYNIINNCNYYYGVVVGYVRH